MAATAPDIIQEAFAKAAREFQKSLNNDKLYREIVKTQSVDDVYDETDKLQAEQAKTGQLRQLSKIRPYLERLQDFCDAINIFQVKPEITAVLWGPIRLLIHLTSTLTQSLDAIINITGEIGGLLPEFKLMATLFSENQAIKDVAVLFFRDILDFYLIALKFFGMNRWRYLFESVWPKQREKIKIITGYIERHASLMRREVQYEQLRGEHKARQQAIEHFEQTEKIERRQEFDRAMTRLNPTFYYRDFDRICDLTYAGTDKWLLEHPLASKWFDTTESSSNLLWLSGIPGAGKTFLAGAAIKEGRLRHRTAFAFLSHAHTATTSALSVIHSIIIQFALEDEDLQSLVCQASTAEMRMNIDSAAKILRDVVQYIGPNYIVVDGIDEIDQREQTRLLGRLVDLCQNCHETRVLISSRGENHITKVLEPKASVIRVHQQNSESIGIFVTEWTKQWLQNRDFLPECQQEIESLLAPLSSKAEGMFLYVRIMIRCIDPLSEIHEIRDELRVLPESLEEAYGRIFRRIHSYQSLAAQEKCRALLGWVCCSPKPMTLRELEQALLVSSNPQGPCRVSSTLNILELCGPIVEVIDGFVNVVHFTVKEYITSPSIENFIDITESKLSLVLSCLRYLCQGHHDIPMDMSEFRIRLVDGDYRLHYYASTMWLDLVVDYLRQKEPEEVSPELITALNTLMETRINDIFDASNLLNGRWHSPLQKLQPINEELFDFVRHFSQFFHKCGSLHLQFSEANSWTVYDTTTIHLTSGLLYKEINEVMCNGKCHVQNCHCTIINRHYGDRVFKCDYLSCPDRRIGFGSRGVRASHHECHSPAWKCNRPSCHYSKLGFLSKRMRDDHRHRHLEEDTMETALLQQDTGQHDAPLSEVVHFNRTAEMKTRLRVEPQPNAALAPPEIWTEATSLISKFGSREMTEMAARVLGDNLFHQAAKLAIESGNVDKMEWLVEKADIFAIGFAEFWKTFQIPMPNANKFCSDALRTAMETESISMRECYKHGLWKLYRSQDAKACLYALGSCLSARVFAATKLSTDREDFLLEVCHGLAPKAGLPGSRSAKAQTVLRRAWEYLTQTTYSIRLGKGLLKLGADVNAKFGLNRTPLQFACQQSSSAAAEFAKFLLYEGAVADASWVVKNKTMHHIIDQEGAKNISQWLGMNWEDLVERVKQDREDGILYPGSFPTSNERD